VRDTRRTRVVLVVLLVAALALIAVNYSDQSSPALRIVRDASGDLFGGVEHAAGSVTGFLGSGSSSSGQVKALQEQVLRLRTELDQEKLSNADYRELRKMLLLAGAARYKIVAATVIAVGGGFQQTVALDAGSRSGVRAGQTVINGEGLVGYVTSVTPDTCTVLLAADASSDVGVAVAPSGQLGNLTGPGRTASGSGLMHLEMLSAAAALKPGEQLVTSASENDRPYVPGVPVGTITRLVVVNGALTESALVQPFVNYTALGVVGVVIVPPSTNPRFAALPPLPHPGPTVTVTVTTTPRPPGHGASSSPSPGG
jgi:rod shape-determining protein MreC